MQKKLTVLKGTLMISGESIRMESLGVGVGGVGQPPTDGH